MFLCLLNYKLYYNLQFEFILNLNYKIQFLVTSSSCCLGSGVFGFLILTNNTRRIAIDNAPYENNRKVHSPPYFSYTYPPKNAPIDEPKVYLEKL